MPEIISAVDISYYPLISSLNHTFYDSNGDQVDFIQSLKDAGVNTVRLRIWHDQAIAAHLCKRWQISLKK